MGGYHIEYIFLSYRRHTLSLSLPYPPSPSLFSGAVSGYPLSHSSSHILFLSAYLPRYPSLGRCGGRERGGMRDVKFLVCKYYSFLSDLSYFFFFIFHRSKNLFLRFPLPPSLSFPLLPFSPHPTLLLLLLLHSSLPLSLSLPLSPTGVVDAARYSAHLVLGKGLSLALVPGGGMFSRDTIYLSIYPSLCFSVSLCLSVYISSSLLCVHFNHHFVLPFPFFSYFLFLSSLPLLLSFPPLIQPRRHSTAHLRRTWYICVSDGVSLNWPSKQARASFLSSPL